MNLHPFRLLGATLLLLLGIAAADAPALAQEVPDARAPGVPLTSTPGPNNAITDVAGVEVGHTTLIAGDGMLVVGQGPVRTGVIAISPARGPPQGDFLLDQTRAFGPIDPEAVPAVRHGSVAL